MSSMSRLGHVCFTSERKQFIHRELAPGRGILILGMAFCMCRKTVKTFPMGRDRTNLRIAWLYKNCPHAGISTHSLFLFILKKRERCRRNFPCIPANPLTFKVTLRWCRRQHKRCMLTFDFLVLLPLLLECLHYQAG